MIMSNIIMVVYSPFKHRERRRIPHKRMIGRCQANGIQCHTRRSSDGPQRSVDIP